MINSALHARRFCYSSSDLSRLHPIPVLLLRRKLSSGKRAAGAGAGRSGGSVRRWFGLHRIESGCWASEKRAEFLMNLEGKRSAMTGSEACSFTKPRLVVKKLLSKEQPEGDGALVRRSIGRPELKQLDPFLLLDYFSGNILDIHYMLQCVCVHMRKKREREIEERERCPGAYWIIGTEKGR
ncbi:hypothetical protein O6H91_02G129300 [Diphasiastrum complanatum]|uniref:Uncharacterized protein n=1 Tax=Diphasiastrum complanatum TaxID=34168 RepID=A0ACC2EKU8_DIPCM|nr:hypothetical protein O6H91_02G129300 [Diphasiastrum complanatum]